MLKRSVEMGLICVVGTSVEWECGIVSVLYSGKGPLFLVNTVMGLICVVGTSV